MPVVSRFYGISVYFYPCDHFPPHFHAIYGEFEASFVIETCEILDGKVPPRVYRLITEWVKMHQDELLVHRNSVSRLRDGIRTKARSVECRRTGTDERLESATKIGDSSEIRPEKKKKKFQ